MFCFRTYHTLKRKVLSLIYSKEPEIYSETVVIGKVIWEATVPSNTFIKEIISSISLDSSITKIRVWSGGDRYKKLTKQDCQLILNQRVKTPWLWIGGLTYMDAIKDCTLNVEPYMVVGNKITLDLLYDIDSSVTEWRYVNPATFENIQFPEEGITINAT